MRAVYHVTAPMDRLTAPLLHALATRTVFHGDTTRAPFLSTSIIVIGDKP